MERTTGFWIPGPATAEQPNRCTWVRTEEKPERRTRYYNTAPGFVAQAKGYGDEKHTAVAVIGTLGERLLVRYPSRQAFSDMVRDPAYQPGTGLRTGALVEAVLQATVPWAAV